MNASATRRLLALASLAACATIVSSAHALNENPHGSAFVVLYQCEANKWIAVGYPAPFARGDEPPARVSWQGSTVLMSHAASGSGARYVSKAADLEWWIKGRAATMNRLSDHTELASCREG